MSDILNYIIGPVITGIIIVIAQFFIQPKIMGKGRMLEELWLKKRDVHINAAILVKKNCCRSF